MNERPVLGRRSCRSAHDQSWSSEPPVWTTPDDKRSNDSAPSHRVYVGNAEIGAAWAKTSNDGRDYLSVKLDDPSFTAPIYANLFEDEDGGTHSLTWSRPTGKRNGD